MVWHRLHVRVFVRFLIIPGGSEMAGDESHELRKDSVGTLEVAALSFAGLAPTMAMALGTSFAAIQAGAAVPLAYLLGMIGSLALAYVIVVFTRRVAASGVAFT